jgi:hypothetical protein
LDEASDDTLTQIRGYFSLELESESVVDGQLLASLESFLVWMLGTLPRQRVWAVDGFVRHRLRSLLQWRLDGMGQGTRVTHHRWPNEWFAIVGC